MEVLRKVFRSESSCGLDIQGCLGPGEVHCFSFFLFVKCNRSYQKSDCPEERHLVRFSVRGMSCRESGQRQGDGGGLDEAGGCKAGDVAASETSFRETQHRWAGTTSECATSEGLGVPAGRE